MNVYEIITERILAEIDKGTLPWHKPWKSELGEESANLVSKKGYRGINRFLLAHLPALSPEPVTPTIATIDKAEQVVSGWNARPTLNHVRGNRAYYTPSQDTVTMPEREQFHSSAEYYSTLFHELTHSTGHTSRLNRPTLVDASYFGSCNYSKEELVAEMGAAFLCGEAGIDNEAVVKNSAAYLDGWRRKLKADNKVVIQAAGQAQKAADHILGLTF